MQRQWRFSQHFLIRYLSFSSKFLIALAKNCVKGWKNVFRLIRFDWHNIFFSINWKNYFDRSILVISMTVLVRHLLTSEFRAGPFSTIIVSLLGFIPQTSACWGTSQLVPKYTSSFKFRYKSIVFEFALQVVLGRSWHGSHRATNFKKWLFQSICSILCVLLSRHFSLVPNCLREARFSVLSMETISTQNSLTCSVVIWPTAKLNY